MQALNFCPSPMDRVLNTNGTVSGIFIALQPRFSFSEYTHTEALPLPPVIWTNTCNPEDDPFASSIKSTWLNIIIMIAFNKKTTLAYLIAKPIFEIYL